MVGIFIMRLDLAGMLMLNPRIVNHLQQHFGAVEINRARVDGRNSGAQMDDTLVVPHLLVLVHFVALQLEQDLFHSQQMRFSGRVQTFRA